MKRKTLFFITIILILLCNFLFVGNSYATSNIEPCPLQSLPLKVYADSSLNQMEISQFQEAINAWNSAGLGTLFIYSRNDT